MRSVEHLVLTYWRSVDSQWGISCVCGVTVCEGPTLGHAIDAFVAHVVGQFAIERPPRDVIDDARRAYEQNQPGGRANG